MAVRMVLFPALLGPTRNDAFLKLTLKLEKALKFLRRISLINA
jgi:hypothetical protein